MSKDKNQGAQCQQQAVVRYTWPGKDEGFACLEHAHGLRAIARAIGFHLQFIPLPGDEQARAACSQNVREEAIGGLTGLETAT